MQSCAIFFYTNAPFAVFRQSPPSSVLERVRNLPPRTRDRRALPAFRPSPSRDAPLRVVIYAARYLLQSPSTRLPTERFMRPVRIMGRYRFALPITAPGQKAPVRICPPRCSHRWTAWHAATNPASTGFVTEFGVFVTFIYIVLHLSSQYTLTML